MSGGDHGQGEGHILNEYGTTDCPVERVRANADLDYDGSGPLICSACGAIVPYPGEVSS